MDSNQFAQQVKQKYPQYASIPNDQLTQAVIKKHPEYQKIVNPTAGIGGAMTNPQQVQLPQSPQQQASPMPQPQAQRPPQQGLGQMDPQDMIKAFARIDPQGAQKIIEQMMQKQLGGGSTLNPLQESERLKNIAEAKKYENPPSEWAPVPGQMSKGGKTLFYNKATREEKEGDIPVSDEKSGEKNQKVQDALEKQYADRLQRVVGSRSGGLGLQDQKVDQAIHLRSMINQSWNPQTKTYEIPEMQQGELVIGLANLMSGSSVSNMEQLRSVTPKTASGDMAHMVSYWTGQPITNQPQAMIKNLVSSIDRQGKVSEKLRDKYMNGLKMLRPKDLDKDRADAIASASLTSSYDDIWKDSPDQQGTGNVQPYSDPQKEARYQAWKKSQGL